ncbi:MAG: ABC transporter ATP-binding protein [Anaerolineae bacterium]|nr:MAG: ABC transporter ATP-binding protein [Anaerolineae bacterium]
MHDPNAVVETHDLTKEYSNGARVRALEAVNLTVMRGDLAAIMGPSGSGKSTLLNLIGALDRPTTGTVCVNGRDLATVSKLDRFRSREVGFVFQLHNLIPTLTAVENAAVPMRGQGLARREREQRARFLLGQVGLEDRADAYTAQLSGGERQRVAIARALANRPSLILADEPTGNLDSESGREVVDLFRRLNGEEGVTVVIVTHDPMMALSCRRIVTLRDGQVNLDEVVDQTYEKEIEHIRETPLGRLFLGRTTPRDARTAVLT